MKRIFLIFTIGLAFAFAAGAQSYSIDWSAIPGGGGASSNGQYVVAGSIGQVGAGDVQTGGGYSLAGGFWSLVSVVQTPGAPVLSITQSASQAVVSWPTPTSSWTLQQTANLTAGWVPSGYPVTATNGISSITVAAPAGNLFFRLSQP